jgi:hypothetical protein
MSLLDPDEQTLTAVTAGPFGANRGHDPVERGHCLIRLGTEKAE